MLSTKFSYFLYDFFILFQHSQYYHIVAIEHLQILHNFFLKTDHFKTLIYFGKSNLFTFSEEKKPPIFSIWGQNVFSTIPCESQWAQPLPLPYKFSA